MVFGSQRGLEIKTRDQLLCMRRAGLVVRPGADTARDTLAWLRATPDAVRTGMSRERESEVLAAWLA